MKNLLLIFVVCSVFFSCNKKAAETPRRQYSKFWKKDIIVDSTLSIRAIEVIDGNIYYASGDGKNGIILDDGTLVHGLVYNDSIDYAFRASAFSGKNLFFMSIESPALLYKLDYHKRNKA